MEKMKRVLVTVALMAGCTVSALSQDGLNVAPFFDSGYKDKEGVTMVSVSGTQMASDDVSAYKSISVTGNPGLADKIAAAVGKDGVLSKSKEVTYKEGRLHFGFFSMGGSPGKRRYLLFLDRRPAGKDKTLLIYLEGSLDEESVKKMIKRE